MTLRTVLSRGILGSSSPLNIRSFPLMPEMILSSSFLLHFRSPFPTARRYGFKPKYLVFWYLVLRAFTCRSFPLQNPITLVVKVRCLSATGFFKWLNPLSTVLNCTLLATTNQVVMTALKRSQCGAPVPKPIRCLCSPRCRNRRPVVAPSVAESKFIQRLKARWLSFFPFFSVS